MLNEGFLFKRGADDFRIFVLFSSPFIRDVLLVPDHVPHCKAAAAVQGREAERPLLEMCVQGWHSLSPCSNWLSFLSLSLSRSIYLQIYYLF